MHFSMSDEDRRRGLTFRNAFGDLGRQFENVTITTPRGTSTIPGQDMETYKEMMIAIQALDNLADSMVKLDQINDETRRIIREARILAVDLRAEIERRVR